MGIFSGKNPVDKFLVSSTIKDISCLSYAKLTIGNESALGKERAQIFSRTGQSVGETITGPRELACKTSATSPRNFSSEENLKSQIG